MQLSGSRQAVIRILSGSLQFRTDLFLGNKKSSLNQNVWRHCATGYFVASLGYISMLNQAEILKKYSVVQL